MWFEIQQHHGTLCVSQIAMTATISANTMNDESMMGDTARDAPA
jgi:hypothetical protein